VLVAHRLGVQRLRSEVVAAQDACLLDAEVGEGDRERSFEPGAGDAAAVAAGRDD